MGKEKRKKKGGDRVCFSLSCKKRVLKFFGWMGVAKYGRTLGDGNGVYSELADKNKGAEDQGRRRKEKFFTLESPTGRRRSSTPPPKRRKRRRA